MSTQEVIAFFERYRNYKNIEMEISGGEPTIRPDLLYLIEYLYTQINIPYILLSNGRRFSDLNFVSKLAEFPPQSIMVALHGHNAELHDKISQRKGSFNETVQGISNLYEYRLNVVIKVVLSKVNYRKMPEFVEFVAQTFPECEGITINGLDISGKALEDRDSLAYKLPDCIPYVQKAIDCANKYNLKIRIFSIPLCLFDESYREYVGLKNRTTIMCKSPEEESSSVSLFYGTADKCAPCIYKSNCSGTWYNYYKYYGTDELKPILKG